MKFPATGTIWKNRNGSTNYQVLFVTNRANLHPSHPMQVVYEGCYNGFKWSLDLDEWDRKMEYQFTDNETVYPKKELNGWEQEQKK